jgi:hypothetical protein
MRVKREKREKGLQSPPGTAHHPKTVESVEVDAAEKVVAGSGTAAIWIVVPRTAPQYSIIIIIIAMPIVFAPFPNIATHVIESPSIGLFLTNRMSCTLRISVIPSVIS